MAYINYLLSILTDTALVQAIITFSLQYLIIYSSFIQVFDQYHTDHYWIHIICSRYVSKNKIKTQLLLSRNGHYDGKKIKSIVETAILKLPLTANTDMHRHLGKHFGAPKANLESGENIWKMQWLKQNL